MATDHPLPALLSRVLTIASKAFNLPTIEDSTQELVQESLADLRRLKTRVSSLSLFSLNESIEDIATKDLVYLFVDYVFAEVEGHVRISERGERMERIRSSQAHLQGFRVNLEEYDIVPEDERVLHTTTTSDPVNRRKMKIKQYQKEKELRAKIEVVRKRRRQVREEPRSDFDLISSLLPSPSTLAAEDDEDDDDDAETEETLREAALLLLRLMYAQAHVQLESLKQELELLRNAPPSPPPSQAPATVDQKQKSKEKEEEMWKLDAPVRRDREPLLDASGKPLRPFTILPSGANERMQLQSQVFRSDHGLPTMSIDEYLEIEKQRGNIITGGGATSAAEPTSSEKLALESEEDGTVAGGEKSEEKRLKDEKWAQYTDENPRGVGNTMNRG